jgi:hypothetical protein
MVVTNDFNQKRSPDPEAEYWDLCSTYRNKNLSGDLKNAYLTT